MRKLLLLALLWPCLSILHAQTPNRFLIQGITADTSSNPLGSATVMLLQRKDSSLVNYTRSNEKGAFAMRNVKRGDYLLKISYVGYIPFQQDIVFADNEVVDMGTLKMKAITKELFEVVIKTARAPLTIKGDTIEYNASSFKVPVGSTVEDLLRKLPGVQVDANGKITAQGQQVQKVTVDGKRFFGNDPKMATQNLPAEAITKVQIFNDKSEQSKVTGVDDGKQEKTINLELKDEFKKGGFGKLTAGGGTDGNSSAGPRGELKANYNKFDDKHQLSLIAITNNTNQTGMSWNDYEDFKGSSSYNGWDDNGNFGFGDDGYNSDENEDGGLSLPVGGNGEGYSNNISGGANYNYNTKKIKTNVSYYYNSTRKVLDALRNRETFLETGSFKTTEESSQINFLGNHRLSFRHEQTLDSLNTFIFTNNSRYNVGNARLNSLQANFKNNDVKSNESAINNLTKTNKFEMANTLIYRLKFKPKKGRSFAASLSYNFTNNDGSADQQSLNSFYNATNPTDVIRQLLDLTNTTGGKTSQIKAGLLFVEPFAKRYFWESFINVSHRSNTIDRDVFDLAKDAGRRTPVDSLSGYYNNNYDYARIGSSLRYSFKGLNLSAGLAVQRFDINGSFTRGVNPAASSSLGNVSTIHRTFTALIPNATFSYDLKNNRYMSANYSVGVTQPSTRDLQPVINNSNPLFISQGNPDLLPEVNHNISFGYNMFNPASFTNIYGHLYYAYRLNQVVYNQQVDPSTLVTFTKPVNISGGQSTGAYIGFGFPLKKTKASMSFNLNPGFSKSLTPINGVMNQTNSVNYHFGARLDLTPSDNFTFFTNASWSINNTKYSINTTQNQQIINHSYESTMNIRLPKDFFITSSLNYQIYINNRYGFNRQIPILNASIYKILGKSKKAEVRLSLYDAFNRNLGVSQTAYQNYVSQERVQTLARYFMLSFTYNMRGIKTTIKRGDSFF
ncbi:outer membrane beta-barrel protein [Runella sp.]|uniref:outer membrane beta-barrel protein n=1 Tax=Runella sp. TaxID=1960881 RepID=UPI003D0ED843